MNAKKTNSISFIFPIHNEEKYLNKQISSFYQSINKLKISFSEILLIENGSSDNSWNIIKKLEKKYSKLKAMRIKHASYGRAIKHGILSTNSKFIFILNLDFFDISFIQKAIHLLKKHRIILGSKTLSGSIDSRNFIRKSLTHLLGFFLKLFFQYPGTDTHGIKVLHNSKILKKTIMSCASKHEFFDTELLIKLTKEKKQKIIEMPIVIKDTRPTRYNFLRRIKMSCIDLYRIIVFHFFKNKSFSPAITIADDYGLSHIINKAIINQINTHSINIVSILPNITTSKEINLLKKNSNHIKFSAHINFLRGKPTIHKNKVSTLVNKKGHFYSLPFFLVKLLFKKIDLNEIQIEAKNQIKQLNKKGVLIKYIDSEQHIHIFPPIWNLFCNTFKNKKIRSIQSSEMYLKVKPPKYLIYLIFKNLLKINYRKLPMANLNKKIYHANIIHPGSNFN